jgi:hypothetical protein
MSRYSKDKPKRADRRKIPELFRAVEKDDRPTVYYGQLISDDWFNFVSFSCHDGDESHLKERVLEKSKFNFSKIDKTDFDLHARRCLHRMKREAEDHRLELDAAEHKHKYATERFQEIVR